MNTFPYAYIRGQTVKIKDAHIPIQSKVIHYGLGVYAGIRGHWHNGNLYLFRPKDHFERMKNGVKMLGMPWTMSYADFRKILTGLIRKNKIRSDVYIRPLVYAGSTQIVPTLEGSEPDFALYMISFGHYMNTGGGLKLKVSKWVRVDDDMIPTKAKCTGLYANSALAKSEAVRAGFDEAVMLNRDGSVAEASSSNLFGVKNGVLYAPPLSANNLDGITRRSIIELAKKELGLKVKEVRFKKADLYKFDEVFLTGTACKIVWVKQVDNKKIGPESSLGGKMGPVVKQLKALIDKAVINELPGYEKWCEKVY
ncbi:branched-chain amino acid transaminase [Candidatus Peregrinibacteria bacterium]|nr:branched-chain amino acid transaminase [Candidatus Peregrinibacteria bacterium]